PGRERLLDVRRRAPVVRRAVRAAATRAPGGAPVAGGVGRRLRSGGGSAAWRGEEPRGGRPGGDRLRAPVGRGSSRRPEGARRARRDPPPGAAAARGRGRRSS